MISLLLLRAKIYLLSAIAPVSFLYFVWRTVSPLTDQQAKTAAAATATVAPIADQQHHSTALILLEFYLLAECLFYLLYRWHLRRLQQYYPHPPHTYALERQDRFDLFNKCLVQDDLRSYVSGWFMHAPFESIKRDNFKEFLTWAFFLEDYGRLTASNSQSSKEMLQDVEEMASSAEKKYNYRFPAGYNSGIRCMRLNLDPMEPRHKPLFYYGILWVLTELFEWYATRWLGFRKFHSRPGPAAAAEQNLLFEWTTEHPDPPERIPYWFRPAGQQASDNDRQSPLVLIHGIGVGVFGYLQYLTKLIRSSHRPILIIELPHVSSMFFPLWHRVIEDVPTMTEMCEFVERVFIRHGFYLPPSSAPSATSSQEETVKPFATVIGHSLGSTVLTWLLRKRPHFIRQAIFVDPVCFLLHYPDVAYNFVYRRPQSFVEWLLWWFASRELYVTWTLNRCFYWYQNILFPQDIPRWCQTAVFIGGKDSIVPGEKVCDYLVNETRKIGSSKVVCDGKQPAQLQPKSPFTVYFYPHMNHAQFLFDPPIENDLVKCSLMGFKLREFKRRDHREDEGYTTSDSPRSTIHQSQQQLKQLNLDLSSGGDNIKTRLRSRNSNQC